MRIFNGRAATEDYMSTHSLTFSTPEMTLKKFVLWLGEKVESPKDEKQQIPRLITYLEDRNGRTSASDYTPDITDTFEPSGAVTDMFGGTSHSDFDTVVQSSKTTPTVLTGGSRTSTEDRLCIKCDSKIKPGSKFCTACGTKQP
jgi:zinc-ribbon domain